MIYSRSGRAILCHAHRTYCSTISDLDVQDLFNWQVGAGAFHVGLQIYGYEYAFGGPMAEMAEIVMKQVETH